MPTLLEMEDRVRAVLDEETAAQWSQTNLRRWLNEGNFDLARTTHHYKSSTTVALTAGTAQYTLADNVLAIEHAYYIDTVAGGSRQVPLALGHWEQMDQVWLEHRDWEGAWPQMLTYWGYSPTLTIRLYPVPSITGDDLQLLVSILPDEMPLSGSDSSAVDVPTAWYDALSDYCRYKAFLRDADQRWQEAYGAYREKRDALMHANDYLGINRSVVVDPRLSYGVPWWIAEPAW